jgi:hypothetical protein
MKQDIKHVSELGQFLIDYDQQHPEQSASQEKEIAKHAKLNNLRDDPSFEEAATSKSSNIWDGF